MKDKKTRLNLGCGLDYRKGNWLNMDFNRTVKADIYCDIEKGIPLETNSIDYVYADMVLEHVKDIFFVMDELWRVCKPGAIIEIYVPHYSGVYATKHLAHYKCYGIGSFDIMRKEITFAGERYNKALFRLKKEELIFWTHDSAKFKWIYYITPNFLFNFSRMWQQFIERFFPLSFDEIHYILEVEK